MKAEASFESLEQKEGKQLRGTVKCGDRGGSGEVDNWWW